jgi:hypothetical protein
MPTTVEITDFVTVENQPIVMVGMDFPVSTGTISVTEEDLIDAVAAQDDPAVKAPRLKLGHGIVGTLNAVEDGGGFPAFGHLENLRYEPEDMTLYGDYVDVPAWLAEIMPTAYANRSFEGAHNATTVTGKKWRLLITAVSLLGVSWPGISTLPDLMAAFSPEGPEGVTVTPVIEAQAAVDDVRRCFYDTVAIGDQYWWWIRDMLIDPNELIVDDDDGGLYRMTFAIADDGEVTLGEPTPVKIEYADVSAKQAVAIAAQGMVAGRGKAIAAHYDNRAASRTKATRKENDKMDPKAIAKRLGLDDGASEEDIVAKLDELQAASTVTPSGGNPPAAPDGDPEDSDDDNDSETDENDKEGETETTPATETLQQLAAKQGLAVVDKATLDTIAAGAKAGADLKAERDKDTRDRLIAAAVQSGKIPPARKDHYAKMYDADPEGTKTLLAEMASVIPLGERGAAATSETDAGGTDDYDTSWLSPHERERIAAAQAAPGSGRVITERGDR